MTLPIISRFQRGGWLKSGHRLPSSGLCIFAWCGPKIGLGYAPSADYMPRRFANRAVKHFEAPAPMASDVVAPAAESAAANGHGEAHSTARFTALLIGSIGVVYGDIGTSPLYAFREAVVAASGSAGAVTPQAVVGVLSLIVWALIIVVTLKYVVIRLRADNNGDGGTRDLRAVHQGAGRHG